MRLSLTDAISFLNNGKVVAVPTETVYGLAASLNQPHAIDQIFALKGRPRVNPLIIHLAHRQDLNEYVTHFPPHFDDLATAFWPGPLTFILSINLLNVPAMVRANLPTAGFRIPELELTRALIEKTGPLVMPSANLSGSPSSTRQAHIEKDFGKNFPVLEGGNCSKGLESTILVFQDEQWMIARLGALPPEVFFPILGYYPQVIKKTDPHSPLCPGQLFRHYAPQAKLHLKYSDNFSASAFILGFKERIYSTDERVILLGSLSNPEEVAKNLYQTLRQLDEEKIKEVEVDMNFPSNELWQTIRERLLRASQC